MDGDDIVVVLKVTGVEEDDRYKLIVDNVADNFGNTMDEKKDTIEIKEEVQGFAPITNIEVVSKTKINVYFDAKLDDKAYGDLDEPSAEDPTNYTIEELGAAVSATLKEDSSKDKVKVVLEVPEMTVGKTYELTVNNVKNLWGYAAEDLTKKFIANDTGLEDEEPEVSNVDYDEKGVLTITFDQTMRADDMDSRKVLVKEIDPSTGKVKTGATTETLVAVKTLNSNTSYVYDASTNVVTNGQNKGTLDKDTEYTILGFTKATGISDLEVKYVAADDERFTTDSEDFVLKDDGIEVDNIYQENGDTLYVFFEEDIKLANGVTDGVATINLLATL